MMGVTHANTQLDAFRELTASIVQFLKNLSSQVVQFGVGLFEPCLQMHSHHMRQSKDAFCTHMLALPWE